MAWGRGDEATDNLSAVRGTTCCYVSTTVRVFGKVTVMCCSERTVYLLMRVILFAHFVAQSNEDYERNNLQYFKDNLKIEPNMEVNFHEYLCNLNYMADTKKKF